MFNFFKLVLSKNIYLNFAEKIETIVVSGLNKISVDEFKKYNFSFLNLLPKCSNSEKGELEEYIQSFDPKSPNFNEVLNYAILHVKKKDIDSLEYEYIKKSMEFLIENYENLIDQIDNFLPKFKFIELESTTQSILLLMKTEREVFWTPKAVLIKEADLLADTFSSPSSVWLVNAVLDKVL